MAFKNRNHSDMRLFKNRLWALMDKNGYENPKELAAALREARIKRAVQRDTSNKDPFDLTKSSDGSIEKTIQRHLNENTADRIKGEWMLVYSKFFGCSLDYLFGIEECQEHNTQFIHEYTGLTEKAIETLREWNNTLGGKFLLSTLNSLIEQKNHFGAVLSCAWNYFNPPKKGKSNSENVIVIDTSGITPSAEETSLFMASNNLVNCIKAAREQYQK